MSQYPPEICESVNLICAAVRDEGWSVDMVIDFGSHARDEARDDSDYDIEVYVHRARCLYLFEEYARRLQDPGDEVHGWHNKIRAHFDGYEEHSGSLERVVRVAIAGRQPDFPLGVLNVHDTRIVLFNLPHETWPLFHLVGGMPIGLASVHRSTVAFLKSVYPFHRRTVEVHCLQCDLARERAAEYLTSASGCGDEAAEARRQWLSSVATYLRDSLSLLSLLTTGWFVARRDEVVALVKRSFPGRYPVAQQVYETKCDQAAHERFLRWGTTTGELGPLTAVDLHKRCEEFGTEIRRAIVDAASCPALNADEAEWLPANLAKYRTLPIYRELVEVT